MDTFCGSLVLKAIAFRVQVDYKFICKLLNVKLRSFNFFYSRCALNVWDYIDILET